MALSRALKDVMRHENGIVGRKSESSEGKRQRHAHGDAVHYEDGGSADKWMQDVHPKKGALHREMHIPEGKKIPTQRLEKAAHSPDHLLNKRANLALRYRGL